MDYDFIYSFAHSPTHLSIYTQGLITRGELGGVRTGEEGGWEERKSEGAEVFVNLIRF